MQIPEIDIGKVKKGKLYFQDISIPLGYYPVVIKNLVNQWPAFRKWTYDYLDSKFGDKRIECFISTSSSKTFLQQENKGKRMAFSRFLAHVYGKERSNNELYYLRIDKNHPLFSILSHDFEIPQILKNYNPNATGIWLGQKGNLTPFHHDWWHSFLAQISGRKHYIIIPLFEMNQLQSHWKPEENFDLKAPPYFTISDLESLNIKYFDGALEPGDILYIPPFWYHQIETLDNGTISIPLRYDTSQTPFNPLFNFAQSESLREITNENTRDVKSIVEILKNNRNIFKQREKSFVKALARVRDLPVSARKFLEKL